MKKLLAALICAVVACACLPSLSFVRAAEETSILGVYTKSSSIIAAPTVIAELADDVDLSAFEGRVSNSMIRPSSLIVEVDGDMNVDVKGEKTPFDTIFSSYLTKKILPIVRVESSAAATAFINYIKTNAYVDFAVVSTDIELVRSVRAECVYIRGVIDYTQADLADKEAWEIAVEANEVGANAVILNEEQALPSFVYDIQARFKAVWVKSSARTGTDLIGNVASGATAIIFNDYKKAYDTFAALEDGILPRSFYGIGHRGLPEVAVENTLEGCIAAYEAGATHIEIDGKICKSGEIVIIHDDDLSRVTGASGSVYNMTLDEIRQHKAYKGDKGELTPCEIPILDDILEYFKDKKDVILIVEIKNTQVTFPAKLNEVVAKYDAYGQVCSIAFSKSLTQKMKEDAPKIPTADLNGAKGRDEFISYLKFLGESHGAIDPSKSYISGDLWTFKNYMARGYLPFYWTQYTVKDTINAVAEGCMGITTDYVDSLKGYVKSIAQPTGLTAKGESELATATFPVSVTTYGGEAKTVNAKVLSYEADQTGADAVLIFADTADVTLNRITQKVRIEFTGEGETDQPDRPVEPDQPNEPDEPNDPSTGSSATDGSSNSGTGGQKPDEGKGGCKGGVASGIGLIAALAFTVGAYKLKRK